MNLVIPLAGEGKRMRPLSLARPKPLIHVAGKPLLAWIYEAFAPYALKRVVPVVSPGRQGETIIQWSKDFWESRGVEVIPAVQEEPLGLGHAVWIGLQALGDSLDDVMISVGDTLFDLDWETTFQRDVSFIGVQEVDDPRRFGIVLTDEEGRIVDLEEKPEHPRSRLAIVGLYYLTEGGPLKDALKVLVEKDIRTREEYQLTDALEILVESQKLPLYAVPVEGWHDAGIPQTLLRTHEIWCERYPYIGEKVDIRGKTKIFPPVVIPDGVVLEDVEVGPFVSVGEGSELRRTRVRHAVLHEHVKVEGAEVEYALVGGHVRISGLRLTGKIGDYTEIVRKKTGPVDD